MSGKKLIGTDEMIARIRVALDARTNPDFVIIARTDAFAVEGLDAAIARASAYEKAGADATIVMSVASEQDMYKITAALEKPTVVMTVEGLRPLVSGVRLREIGYPLAVYPVSLLQAQVYAQKALLKGLRVNETASVGKTATLSEIACYLNLPHATQVACLSGPFFRPGYPTDNCRPSWGHGHESENVDAGVRLTSMPKMHWTIFPRESTPAATFRQPALGDQPSFGI
jgi:hypothetical protein